eukprot:TRINITY_DN20986_c0_g1_i1.p1 TRINITY_DN20986_c0_g1~~TRINITY_DN20986_c0_g1_i1.p1  ORF type:complete len:146 (+),score=72.87 TRINITY_DN20986_c0_g1_i1:164-601(+)
MAKSKKGFAKQNGRKKARLARTDTKKRKMMKKKEERLTAKIEEGKSRAAELAEVEGDAADPDWTDIGSVTTGGGLRMTPVQREKVRQLTRRQAVRKEKKQMRGTAYQQRSQKDAKISMARRIHKKIEGKQYRKELDELKASKPEF